MTFPIPALLFVDDEPGVLQGLRRTLRNRHGEWDMMFAGSGQEALDIMSRAPVDVLVTDMRMPGIDGAELMHEVAERHPVTVRIVLSGQCDEQSLSRTVGVSHQYLAKPCDAGLLEQKVSRALGLRRLLATDKFRTALGGLRCIPSAPATYVALVNELHAGGYSDRLAEIAEQDPALTARLLQVANSAYFGASRDVRTARQAMNFLGFEALRALALEQGLAASLEPGGVWADLIADCSRHSLMVATLARDLARARCADTRIVEETFTGGMLHDVGQWVLAQSLGFAYATAMEVHKHHGEDLSRLEVHLTGTDHSHIAAYLLALWALPDPIVEAAFYHHDAARLRNHAIDTPMFVWAADALLSGRDAAMKPSDLPNALARSPGLWDQWRRQRDQFLEGARHAAA